MKKLLAGLFFLSLITGSCSLQKVAVKVYTPPKVEYPPELRAFMVTSRYVPAKGPYEDVQWGAYESVDSIQWKISESVVDTIGKHMVDGNYFLVKTKHYPRMLRNNNAELPEALPWEGLAALANKELVQGYLVLEGFGQKPGPVEVKEENGKFIASRNYMTTLAIRAYETEKRRIIDDSIYHYNTVVQGFGDTREAALAAMPDAFNGAEIAAGKAAAEFVRVITPARIPETRQLYVKGDSLLMVADSAIRMGNWNRAEGKWNYLAYKAKDTLIQARASYNMAVACERDGRLNQALGFANRSQRLHPSQKTEDYIAILEKKLQQYQEMIKRGDVIRNW
jgi:hypothetical protein